MREAGWPCLSTGTPCAESRNSSPMAPELQGPGLTSVSWAWPPGGSRALGLPWSKAAAQAQGSAVHCCQLHAGPLMGLRELR